MATLWTPKGEKEIHMKREDRIQLDWQEHDYQIFNPPNDARFMNYVEYKRRRLLPYGDPQHIKAPNRAEVIAQSQAMVHNEIDGA